MYVVVDATDNKGNATKVFYDTTQIGVNFVKVSFTHFYALAFDVEYQVYVDFYKSAGHIVFMFVLLATGFLPLLVFCCPFRANC